MLASFPLVNNEWLESPIKSTRTNSSISKIPRYQGQIVSSRCPLFCLDSNRTNLATHLIACLISDFNSSAKNESLQRQTVRHPKYGAVIAANHLHVVQFCSEKQTSLPTMKLRHRVSYLVDKIRCIYLAREYEFANLRARLEPNRDFAVVLHLYYPELWPQFDDRLKKLPKSAFNLFVTIPKQKIGLSSAVTKSFPDAEVIPVPNRGRDVLPFLMLMRELRNHKYNWILKLHSKKSPQIEGGSTWLNNILNCLLPTHQHEQTKLLEHLLDHETGIIGPEGYFFKGSNLIRNNERWLNYCDRYLFDNTGKLVDDIANSGFFAGTMFWLKPSMSSILQPLEKPSLFEAERGQTDSTLAHAIERIMPYSVARQGKKVMQYGISGLSPASSAYCNTETWQGEPIFP